MMASFDILTQKQLDLIHQMNDHNFSHDKLEEITHKQETLYNDAWEQILRNKKYILKLPLPYQKEVLFLEKRIKINKAKNNDYDVIRDEVRMKSYQILQEQDKMLKHILRTLDLYNSEEFSKDMNKMFIRNQVALRDIDSKDYRPYLEERNKSAIVHHVQKSIKDYYALLEINSDKIKYFSMFEHRLYRLNRYNNYYILPLALYLDHSEIGKMLNPILYPYHLSIVKLFLIVTISFYLFI